MGPTVFRVSSYNILGASHSAPGGRHARFASAGARLPWALDLLNGANVSVAGFQEFQPEQISMFSAIAPSWDIYPGPGGAVPRDLTNFEGTLFLRAADGHGFELWQIPLP